MICQFCRAALRVQQRSALRLLPLACASIPPTTTTTTTTTTAAAATTTTHPSRLPRLLQSSPQSRRFSSSSAAAAAAATPGSIAVEAELKERPSMTPAEASVAETLTSKLRPTRLLVQDISGGCGSMYAIDITSAAFRGLSVLKQQRLVNAALGDLVKGWHGVQIRTKAPLEEEGGRTGSRGKEGWMMGDGRSQR